MSEERLAFGRWGEDEAVRYLQRSGVSILIRNYRTPVGEIDIIGRKKRFLIFFEVKARRTLLFGTPQEAVGLRKQRQIVRTAQWYLSQNKTDKLQPRFDVISVVPGENGRAQIEHVPDAFNLDFLDH
ncbi:MAG TPA: YraN family protein [Geopsychrobacteraceae bacterium]|nr:YraN family protein [Geopsychrobacteraceae bacterium]